MFSFKCFTFYFCCITCVTLASCVSLKYLSDVVKEYICNIDITIKVYYKFKGRMISKSKQRGTKKAGAVARQEQELLHDQKQVKHTKYIGIDSREVPSCLMISCYAQRVGCDWHQSVAPGRRNLRGDGNRSFLIHELIWTDAFNQMVSCSLLDREGD